MQEGCHEEGLDLLRNSHVAARLTENDRSTDEFLALHSLIDALFKTDAIDEVEPLVPRYRELAKGQSSRQGRLCFQELRSYSYMALFHEARGRRQEAAREVRSLLDLLRENEGAVRCMLEACKDVMEEASSVLSILDPELGEEQLVRSVAAELANFRELARKAKLQERPQGA